MSISKRCQQLVCFIVLCGVSACWANEKQFPEIYVQPNTKTLLNIAKEFGEYLHRITGTEYSVREKRSEGRGISLLVKERKGKNAEFVEINCDGTKTLTISGNSDVAVRDGTYIYLEKLGCRWFFASKRWNIIPRRKSAFIKIHISTQPDYRYRNIWYQYGFGWGKLWKSKKIERDYRLWFKANRLGGIAPFHCGHSWDAIIRRNKGEFDKHPEYYALGKDGKTRLTRKNNGNPKFCCTNPGLLKLVAQDRLERLRELKKRNRYEFMVSVDPSDGYGFCHCNRCNKLGNGTDRPIFLANYVARYLRKFFPDAWVGLYAYADHSAPPTLDVEDNVYVQIATAFNKSKYTYDDLIRLWGKKAGAIGIREYYGVMAWDWNLPGRGRGADIKYISRTIPYWHKFGATSINAESSNNWGMKGLGYYIAAKLMWDVHSDVNLLIDDFYEQAFGEAKDAIRKLYEMWRGGPPLLDGYIAEWLEQLKVASEKTHSPQILARINDLKAYMHYVVLYHEFAKAQKGEQARKRLFQLLEYTYRIKSRNMIHSYALARRLANGRFPAAVLYKLPDTLRGKNKKTIKKWEIFNKKCEWQENKTELSDADIDSLFANDVNRYSKYKGTIKEFSNDLIVPRRKLIGVNDGRAKSDSYRYKVTFYVLFPKRTITVEFEGAGSLSLYDRQGTTKLMQINLRKGEKKKVVLKVPCVGLYRVITDGWYKIRFPDNIRYVLEASPRSPCQPMPYAGPMYFYVPKGCKSFTIHFGNRLIVKSPDGKIMKFLSDKQTSCAKIKVTKGNDGKIWSICWLTAGRFFFTDIPPYVSVSPNSILLLKGIK